MKILKNLKFSLLILCFSFLPISVIAMDRNFNNKIETLNYIINYPDDEAKMTWRCKECGDNVNNTSRLSNIVRHYKKKHDKLVSDPKLEIERRKKGRNVVFGHKTVENSSENMQLGSNSNNVNVHEDSNMLVNENSSISVNNGASILVGSSTPKKELVNKNGGTPHRTSTEKNIENNEVKLTPLTRFGKLGYIEKRDGKVYCENCRKEFPSELSVELIGHLEGHGYSPARKNITEQNGELINNDAQNELNKQPAIIEFEHVKVLFQEKEEEGDSLAYDINNNRSLNELIKPVGEKNKSSKEEKTKVIDFSSHGFDVGRSGYSTIIYECAYCCRIVKNLGEHLRGHKGKKAPGRGHRVDTSKSFYKQIVKNLKLPQKCQYPDCEHNFNDKGNINLDKRKKHAEKHSKQEIAKNKNKNEKKNEKKRKREQELEEQEETELKSKDQDKKRKKVEIVDNKETGKSTEENRMNIPFLLNK